MLLLSLFDTPKASLQPTTAKRVKGTSMVKANLDFKQECQKALKQSTNQTTEYEAVGINVAKKLDKMDNTQAICAETLINLVLQKGLL